MRLPTTVLNLSISFPPTLTMLNVSLYALTKFLLSILGIHNVSSLSTVPYSDAAKGCTIVNNGSSGTMARKVVPGCTRLP